MKLEILLPYADSSKYALSAIVYRQNNSRTSDLLGL